MNAEYTGKKIAELRKEKNFTQKQLADISLNVNGNLADWYGEGDNWGRSTRMIEKWFWFEASF